MTFFRLSLGWRFEAGGRAQCGADVNVAVINEGELCQLFVRFFFVDVYLDSLFALYLASSLRGLLYAST